MLEVAGLAKQFPGGVQALRGVDFRLHSGEIVAVIGPSGAGKSTLLRCINRLVEPDAGEVLFRGANLRAAGRRELRQIRGRIGMVFQAFALVDRLTVRQNILCGALGRTGLFRSLVGWFHSEDARAAGEWAARVGLAEFLDRRADALSGGQRQRVGIARALLQRPEMLLVDEATASLDPRTSRQVMRLLVALAREEQIGVLMNIHDVPLARSFVDRVIGLSEGLVVFEGKPQELTPAVLTSIYGEEDWGRDEEGLDD